MGRFNLDFHSRRGVLIIISHESMVRLREYRLPPLGRYGLRSSGLLRSVCWQMFTDVSKQSIRPIFKGKASQNFLNCLSEDLVYKLSFSSGTSSLTSCVNVTENKMFLRNAIEGRGTRVLSCTHVCL